MKGQFCLSGSIMAARANGQEEHGETGLAINDLAPGVKDGGVVHNFNVSRLQLLGQVELWALSQGSHSPAPNHDLLSKQAPDFATMTNQISTKVLVSASLAKGKLCPRQNQSTCT